MSNKQSSVQWLTMTLSHLEVLRYHGGMEAYDYLEAKTNALIQAKSMHMEEVIEAWSNGYDEEDRATSNPIKYYNETYGGESESK